MDFRTTIIYQNKKKVRTKGKLNFFHQIADIKLSRDGESSNNAVRRRYFFPLSMTLKKLAYTISKPLKFSER